jgi:hypothetical protein
VPNRHGFTLELGLGAALTFVTREYGTSVGPGGPQVSVTRKQTDTYVGYAPLSIGIGGFISPRFALLFRATGTAFFEYGDQWANGIYGGVLQFWPSDNFFLSAGGGVALIGQSSFVPRDSSGSLTGFGFSARAGVAVANFTHHSLRIDAEVLPAFYERRSAVGTAIVFAWQYF